MPVLTCFYIVFYVLFLWGFFYYISSSICTEMTALNFVLVTVPIKKFNISNGKKFQREYEESYLCESDLPPQPEIT